MYIHVHKCIEKNVKTFPVKYNNTVNIPKNKHNTFITSDTPPMGNVILSVLILHTNWDIENISIQAENIPNSIPSTETKFKYVQ